MDIQRFMEHMGSQRSISLTISGEGLEEHCDGDLMSVSEGVGGDILIRMVNGNEFSFSEEKISDIEYYDDMKSYHVILPNIGIWIGMGEGNLP